MVMGLHGAHPGAGRGGGHRHRHGHRGGPHRRPAAGTGGGRDPPAEEDGGDLQGPVLRVPVRVRGDVRGGPAPGPAHAGDVPHRRVPGGGRHPRGPARHRHHRAGPGRGAHGKAPGHRQKAARRGDPGLRRGDLLGQDGHAHPEQNDRGGGVDAPPVGAGDRPHHRRPVLRRRPDLEGEGAGEHRRPHRGGPGGPPPPKRAWTRTSWRGRGPGGGSCPSTRSAS